MMDHIDGVKIIKDNHYNFLDFDFTCSYISEANQQITVRFDCPITNSNTLMLKYIASDQKSKQYPNGTGMFQAMANFKVVSATPCSLECCSTYKKSYGEAFSNLGLYLLKFMEKRAHLIQEYDELFDKAQPILISAIIKDILD